MKEESCLLPLLAILGLGLVPIVDAHRDVNPCRLFPHGTKLRHPDDCSQEIICTNMESVNGTKCPDSTPFYNKDTYKCQTHLSDNSTCDINCSGMVNKFIADRKSCFGYYYCLNEELAIYGFCPTPLHFNEYTQSCVYRDDSECRFNKLNFCGIVTTGVKFKDETNCGRYNVCALNSKTKVIELKNEQCATNAPYFDAVKGACVAEPINQCHPVPSDVCIVNKKIKRNYFVNDGATCRGSFYCADVGNFSDPNPKWNQCPGNKFFSQDKQKCLDPKQVVCLNDRCEGSTKKFVTSSHSGCRHYVTCENGVQVGEGTCGNNFFDEEAGFCTSKLVIYPACYYK